MTIPAHTPPELGALPAWLHLHIRAIEDSKRAGFMFLYLPSLANLSTLQGIFKAHGAMDIYSATSTSDAVAARFRLEDLETDRPRPLWHAHGSVTDVVRELMQLPPHGSKGAPSLALPLPGDLWVPPFA
ncbi:hypothetical protein [Saccharopolyspora elongata]|uniref:Uncharacterized protein n=1 Tax=Saccharopolyspora elongata TaxID=2530387 RepID=A0A4R4Y6A0_9PSEU|nr:hypothetical protein [Saccharopolyspora elongata]TDD39855.1 hypothetical protein E1288_36165 [Saccharopolyspora elongata]